MPRKPIKKRAVEPEPIVPSPQQIHKHLKKISRGFKALLNGVTNPNAPDNAITDLLPKDK